MKAALAILAGLTLLPVIGLFFLPATVEGGPLPAGGPSHNHRYSISGGAYGRGTSGR
jgi:hypothetical protein